MKFIDLLEQDQVVLNAPFISKKRLFEFVANKMADESCSQMPIYQSFVDREKLGNTSLGNGVAIPHGKCLLHTEEVLIKLIRLSKVSDYESTDGNSVGFIVAMAFPVHVRDIHKQIMKEAVQIFKQHRLYKGLLQAESRKEVIDLILETHQQCSNWSS